MRYKIIPAFVMSHGHAKPSCCNAELPCYRTYINIRCSSLQNLFHTLDVMPQRKIKLKYTTFNNATLKCTIQFMKVVVTKAKTEQQEINLILIT